MSKLSVVKTAVTSKAGRSLLLGQKHSPVLLFGAGMIGFVGTVVLASKATLKLEDVLDDYDVRVDQAREVVETDKRYTAKDFTKDSAVLRVRLYKDVARLYAPALGLGVVTVCALGGSHVILTKRNAGLMAAYAALDKTFADYRGKVVEKLGEDEERKLRYEGEVKQVVVDGETTDKIVKDARGRSQYAKTFSSQTSKEWDRHPEYNLVFLRTQQKYANDLLQARGHVLLNDVYESLGFERTKAGAVVGWVKGEGDDLVDFGIFTGENGSEFYEFMTGRDGELLLDFNVDGVIYDKI